MNREIKNARIESTSLGFDRVFSCWLHLDYGGSGQGFGGYCLWNLNNSASATWGAEFIERILNTVGVQYWEELKGKHIRVDAEKFGKIHGIGHYLKDDWFYPQKDLAYLQEEK
jgi:hypothetical protein